MTMYPQLNGLECPYCHTKNGRRGAMPIRVNRKRIVVQYFHFECGGSASCTKDCPEVQFAKRCDVVLEAARTA